MSKKKLSAKNMQLKKIALKKTPGGKANVGKLASKVAGEAVLAAKKTKAGLPKARVKARVKKAVAKAAAIPALARALERETVVDATVLDRLAATVLSRRSADPAVSHSARLLSRGTAKVAQKFGEEAVECLIEAVTGDRGALITESADVLYHLVVLWVNAGVEPAEVWEELRRREGVSGIAEKARRRIDLPTTKIP